MQPIWTEGERSIELFNNSGNSKSMSLPFYPQRVSPQIFSDQNSSSKLTTSPKTNSDSELASSLDDNPADYSSAESEAEIEVTFDTNKEKAFHFGLIYLCSLFTCISCSVLCLCFAGKKHKNGIV